MIKKMLEEIVSHILNDNLDSIRLLLDPLSQQTRSKIINTIISDVNSEYYKSNLLLVAGLKNRLGIIKYLIKECKADIEMQMSLKRSEDWDNLTFFTNYSNAEYNACFNMTASVLWHLCRDTFSDNLEPVKLLLSLGANVNSTNESYFNSTPLMAACSRCNLKLVKFLVENHKADVKIFDKNGENCLFYAIRHQEDCLDLLKYLVRKGLCLKQKNRFGRSLVHLSIELKHHDPFKYIMEHNPDVPLYLSLDNPLIQTAINGDYEKFNILFKKYNFDVQAKIYALEIIGSKLSEHLSGRECAIFYWDLSLDERYQSKIYKNPIQIEGFIKEFNSIDDLKQIAKYPLEIIMQNLLIRERVLLKFNQISSLAKFNLYSNLDLSNKYNFESFFANNYGRLQYLWTILLSLQIKYLKPIDDSVILNIQNFVSFQNYIQTNRTLAKYNLKLSQEYLIKTLKICLYEIKRCVQIVSSLKILFRHNPQFLDVNFDDIFEFNDERLSRKNVSYVSCYSKDPFVLFECLEVLKRVSVVLLRLLMSYKLNDEEEKDVKIIVRNLVILDESFKGENSILALSLKPNLLKNYEYQNMFKTYDPVNVKCVDYFLRCGADANSKEFLNKTSKNNCLNSCIVAKDVVKNKGLVDELVKLLLKHGAHLDFKNDINQNFVQKYENKFRCVFINKYNHLSLKCLCAQVIKSNMIVFQNELPNALVEFVDLH